MTYFGLPLLAYLDPFTGSLILQVIAAFLIGSTVVLRKYLMAPIKWFRRRKNVDSHNESELYE